MDLLTEMIEQYQGTEYETDLDSLSEKMANFETDEVIKSCHGLQQQLSA